jgi:hypothetical protein
MFLGIAVNYGIEFRGAIHPSWWIYGCLARHSHQLFRGLFAIALTQIFGQHNLECRGSGPLRRGTNACVHRKSSPANSKPNTGSVFPNSFAALSTFFLHVERRFDPLFRPAFEALLRDL